MTFKDQISKFQKYDFNQNYTKEVYLSIISKFWLQMTQMITGPN